MTSPCVFARPRSPRSQLPDVMAMMSIDAITNRWPFSSSSARALAKRSEIFPRRRGSRRVSGEPKRLVGRDAHAAAPA